MPCQQPDAAPTPASRMQQLSPGQGRSAARTGTEVSWRCRTADRRSLAARRLRRAERPDACAQDLGRPGATGHPPRRRARAACAYNKHTEKHARSGDVGRSEEHTSELQSLMRISYAVFCLKKKKK